MCVCACTYVYLYISACNVACQVVLSCIRSPSSIPKAATRLGSGNEAVDCIILCFVILCCIDLHYVSNMYTYILYVCVYYNHTISRSVSSSIHIDIYTMYMYIRLYIHNIPIPIHIVLFLLFGA